VAQRGPIAPPTACPAVCPAVWIGFSLDLSGAITLSSYPSPHSVEKDEIKRDWLPTILFLY